MAVRSRLVSYVIRMTKGAQPGRTIRTRININEPMALSVNRLQRSGHSFV